MAKVGRPSTITPEAIAAITDNLREGVSWPDACALADVNESTARVWRTRGQEQLGDGKKTVFTEFLRGVNKARAEARLEWLKTVKAGQTGALAQAWQSASWLLERSDFEHWGNKSKLDLSNEDGTLTHLVWPWEADAKDPPNRLAKATPGAGNGNQEPGAVQGRGVRKKAGQNGTRRRGES